MNHIKILATVIWLSGMLILVPMTVSAATLTQAQINAIVSLLQSFGADQGIVSSVQATLSGGVPTVTPAAWCHTFNTNLGIGNNNDEVVALVQALVKEGVTDERGSIYNYDFDESLASAVSAFQQKYKDEILTPLGLQYGTGFVGSATRAKLNKLYGCGIQTSPPVCIQVITPAQNPQTGECKEFSTPCDVPVGWQKVNKCVSTPIACTEQICSGGYISYDTGEKDANGCPIKKCIIPPTGNQPPVIYGVGGPTTLKINETGTWTVKAGDPEQGILNYSVVWGDEPLWVSSTLVPKSTTYNQTATFTHSYASAGVYYLNVTVTDNQGLSAKTSISVNVGGVQIQTGSMKITVSYCPPPIYCFTTPCPQPACQILTNAEVSVYDANGNFIGTKNTSAGTAVFENLPVGVYAAVAGANGYEKNKSEFKIVANTNGYLTINLQKSTVVSSITVLSPNGGEQWQVGETHRITWSSNNVGKVRLYVYIPDAAYLGSGSTNYISDIIPNTGYYDWTIVANALPPFTGKLYNNYKIRVDDLDSGSGNVTVSDSSDAPFSIVATTAMNVDLKVNGSDSPTTIPYGSTFTASWISTGATYCTGYGTDIIRTDGGVWTTGKYPASGSQTLYAKSATGVVPFSAFHIGIQCWDSSGKSVTDLIENIPVGSVTQPSITVLSPNGGETFVQTGAGQTTVNYIKWSGGTFTTMHVSLTTADATLGNIPSLGVIWSGTPNSTNQTSWNGGTICQDEAGFSTGVGCSIIKPGSYKIYIVGDVAGMIGQAVTDISDAAFSIVANTTQPLSTLTVSRHSASPSGFVTQNATRTDLLRFTITGPVGTDALNAVFSKIGFEIRGGYASYLSDLKVTDSVTGTVLASAQGPFSTGVYDSLSLNTSSAFTAYRNSTLDVTISAAISPSAWDQCSTCSKAFWIVLTDLTQYSILPAYPMSGLPINGHQVYVAPPQLGSDSSFFRNLTMGSTGDDVKLLQALLISEVGYSADLITGYFGRITSDAVKKFQEKYGVNPVSGYFGEITRKVLNALISDR